MQGQLRSANVGDSGYMLLTRAPGGGRYELRYHTPQQEHSFGCPYQLGHYEGADAPEDAMLMTLPVSSRHIHLYLPLESSKPQRSA